MRITHFKRSLFMPLLLMTMALATPILLTNHSDLMAQGRRTLNPAVRNYESGFRAGQQDARRNWDNNYLRHRRAFNPRWEADFRQGYADGYENRYSPGYPNGSFGPYGYRDGRGDDRLYDYGPYGNGSYGYTSEGSMIWRGRVDHSVELRVRGNRVESIERQGASTINEAARFTSPLPRAEMQVFVSKRAGRGRVDLIQQPSRFNGYTAVIGINDEKGGADDYEIEIGWR